MRFLLSSWPWRALIYVGGTLVSCVLTFLAFIALGTVPPALLLIGIPTGVVERWRLRIIERKPIPNPHLPMPLGLDWLQRRVTETGHVARTRLRGHDGGWRWPSST